MFEQSMTAPSEDGDEVPVGLTRLSEVVLGEESLEAILAFATSVTHSTLDGADGVSLSLIRDGGFATSAAIPEDIAALDAAQYARGSGPCVEATRSGETVEAVLAQESRRWPEFIDAARRAGYETVRSAPLRVRDRSVGSMNVYSRRAERFSDSSCTTADRVAQHIAVVLANAAAFSATASENTQLKVALETRERIGQAKGILMARHGITSDEAFDSLRRQSNTTNRRLRDIAQDIIDSATDERAT